MVRKVILRAASAGARHLCWAAALALALTVCSGCSKPDGETDGRPSPSGGAGHPGASGAQFGGGGQRPGAGAAVPVEAKVVERRDISSYIETNGTLEAENEVDLVARVAAPIIELKVEEGVAVRRGQLLARLDGREIRARSEISRVSLNEAKLAYERALQLLDVQLISPEDYDSAVGRYETAKAQYESDEIQLGYTEIRAPFDGLVIVRYVNFAEQVSVNTPLFRLSDFVPLLCPIQIPERELPRLSLGQRAFLTLEAWPDERFPAEVLRISPVVDAATGTVKVTLEVDRMERLRPGMFARVFVETETRADTLVILKSALSLESIGDTVYVVDGGTASRREVTLGFQEGDFVEVTSGVREGEMVVTVGQDGLSEGTPIQVLGTSAPQSAAGEAPDVATAPAGMRQRPDFSKMTPEQLERAKDFMRARGLSEEQIEERIRQARPASP